MEEDNKHKRSSADDFERGEFVDEATQRKINSHLHNIADNISAEDIRNIRTDVSNDTLIPEKKEQFKINKEAGLNGTIEELPTS